MKKRFATINPEINCEDIRSYITMNFGGFDDPELLRRGAYLTSLYDGELKYTDDAMRSFFQTLRKNRVLDRTVCVVTSDHGEAFLEHHRWGHRQYVHGEEIDIPLIWRIPGPGDLPMKGEFNEPVSLIDLYPTLLDMLDLPVPSGLDGLSLWPLMKGEKGTGLLKRPIFSEMIIGSTENVSSIYNGKKAIRACEKNDTRWIFFDLKNDPKELKLLTPEEVGPDLEFLKQSIESLVERRILDFDKPVDVGAPSQEELKQLEHLGYL